MKEILKKVNLHSQKLAQYYGHYEFLGECLKYGIAPKGLIPKMPLDAFPPEVRHSFINLQYIHALQTTHLLHTQYLNLCTHHKNNLDDTIQVALMAFPHLYKSISNILTRAKGNRIKDKYRLFQKLSKLIAFYNSQGIQVPFPNSIPTHFNLNLRKTNFSNLFYLPPPLPHRQNQHNQSSLSPNTHTPPADADEGNLMNLSSKTLSCSERSVLSKGLSFCPTSKIDIFQITKDILKFGRDLKWKYFWQSHTSSNSGLKLHEALQKFKPPSSNEPPPLPPGHPIDIFLDQILLNISDPNFIANLQSNTHNLTKSENIALSKLKNDESIIVLPADKGSTTVLLNKSDYTNEGLRQLNDSSFYTTVLSDPCEQIVTVIRNYLSCYGPQEGLSDLDISMLTPPNPRTPHFYMLPKIHKQGHPGRPIVASYDCPTERVSAFVDFHLQPLVKRLDSHISDTYHFLEILNSIKIPINTNIILATIDVVSLYTNIPHVEGLQSLNEYLDSRPFPHSPSSKFLIDLAEIVLTKNYFSFENNFYHQIKGTAMGTRMAPSYANLFMGAIETKFLNNEPLKPLLWLRFIDDIFVVWPHSLDNLQVLLQRLNQFSCLKFTHTISTDKITFLDVDILYQQNKFNTSVHFKETNKLQYLHFNSCHPSHTKRSIPHSLTIRGKRICNNSTSLDQYKGIIFDGLCRRDYPPKFLYKHMNRSRYHNTSTTQTQLQNSVRLIIPYFHGAHKIQKLLRDLFPILSNNNLTRNLLSRCPSVTYKQKQNLKSILNNNKRTHNNQPAGTHKCNKPRCKTCPLIKADVALKTPNSPTLYKIQNFACCTTTHCIYILECKHCNSFYIGETTTSLRTRMNGHRHTVDSHPNNILPVPSHARTHNLTFNECFTVRVVKTFPPTIRTIDLKTWESSFIRQLGAFYSPGLNISH